MIQQIGDEMQERTHALSPPADYSGDINILDICMAPGGYTTSALKYSPGATTFGISLPRSHGGHKVLSPFSRSTMRFLDVTMLAKEFGVDTPPFTHPHRSSFLDGRPFFGQIFQLIFCDGQVLRTHQRPEYREHQEARRLTLSQLILAMQRIQAGGTLIVLLHKIEIWDTAELLYLFNRFSSIQVFKPVKKHAKRSSFYLIAKNVQPDADAAKVAIESWKRAWWQATFGGENGTGGKTITVKEEYVQTVLNEFGNSFVELARPIWQIQANALREWVQSPLM
jgi:23S rRNA U2552 (ribose-2'-O)-methylase RlmE/FtsJ